MARLDPLFEQLVERDASDLHMTAGLPVKMRIHGDLEIVREEVLAQDEASTLMRELVDEDQWDSFLTRSELDFAYGVEGVVRLRANYFKHHDGYGAVFRVIPDKIPTWSELQLPKVVVKLAQATSGLILITGPTGSGKTTTLAALIDTINSRTERHIITIEEPIEFIHTDQHSVIVQREVGMHTESFAQSMRSVIRQDPDVILVGEMRDRETMALALDAAEMGFLVFGTLHTNGAGKAIDRISDLFPAESQDGIRLSLANNLRAVVSQLLLKNADNKGRCAIVEVLVGTRAVQNIIREGKTTQLISLMQRSASAGMQTMDQALLAAVMARRIDGDEAWRKAEDKSLFGTFISKHLKELVDLESGSNS